MRSRWFAAVAAAAVVVSSAVVPARPAAAAAGAPVATFGKPATVTNYSVGEGGAVHDLDGDDALHELAPLPDGRFYGAGVTTAATAPYHRSALVARFTENGLLDATFSGDGWVAFDVMPSTAFDAQRFEAIAATSGGGAVAAGWHSDDSSHGQSLVAKVSATGLPDITFGGGDGVLTLDRIPGYHESATDVVVNSDGSILLGVAAVEQATGSTHRHYVMKLTSSGLDDLSFGGGDGIVEVGLGGTGFGTVQDYTIGGGSPRVALHDGSIVVAGAVPVADGDADLVVERYTGSGALDPTFGTGGRTVVDVDLARRRDTLTDLVVTSSGVVLGARTGADVALQAAVVRLTPGGQPVTTFGGGDGSVTVGSPRMRGWEAGGVAVQPDGRIVIAGGGNDRGAVNFDFRFARLTPTGELDAIFDGDGHARVDASTHERVLDVMYTANRLVAAGAAGSAPDTDLALAAVDAQDSPLPTFAIADATMVEGEVPGGGQLRVPVTLSSAVPHRTQIDIATVDIETQYDFFHVDGALVFEPGQTRQYVHVSVGDDTTDENDERFRIVLSNPERAGIADGEAVVRIIDEDPGPAITASSVRGAEGSTLTFEFRLSEPSPAPVRFIAATQPGNASEGSDYTYSRQVYEIPPGATSATFTVPTNDDDADEADETFRVRLHNVDNARSFQEPIGTIADNDPAPSSSPPTSSQPASPSPSETSRRRQGYWMVGRTGDVHAFGDAAWLGNTDEPMNTEVVDLEPTATNGYWTVTNRGQVYTHGDARWFGGSPPLSSHETVTSLSRTADGAGYWLFTTLGRVFAYGNAAHYGDMGGRALNGPVLDSIPTASGRGYYMVASDGGIFTFGDARFLGSMGHTRLNAPVQSLVPDPDGSGYWLVASDGGIFSFDAHFYGSMGHTRLNKPVTGMVGFGAGYLMVGEDGGIFTFGDAPFKGSLGDRPPAQPIVAAAVLDQS